MRTTPRSRSRIDTHEHDWYPVEGRYPLYEDGALIFQLECEWVEINGATHSEKHDEVFYDEGAECNETKTVRFDIEEVSISTDEKTVDMTPEDVFDMMYEHGVRDRGDVEIHNEQEIVLVPDNEWEYTDSLGQTHTFEGGEHVTVYARR
jgi:hypothetical protein